MRAAGAGSAGSRYWETAPARDLFLGGAGFAGLRDRGTPGGYSFGLRSSR